MLLSGDEISRTKRGNNNTYCQDNEISWLNWETADKNLLDFAKKLIHFRKNHPAFCRRRWFKGQPIKGVGLDDIAWFLPEGTEMDEAHWNEDYARSLGVFLNGKGIHSKGFRGETITDDSFFVIFNGNEAGIDFKLPPSKYGQQWKKAWDTAHGFLEEETQTYGSEAVLNVEGRSIMVLSHPIQ